MLCLPYRPVLSIDIRLEFAALLSWTGMLWDSTIHSSTSRCLSEASTSLARFRTTACLPAFVSIVGQQAVTVPVWILSRVSCLPGGGLSKARYSRRHSCFTRPRLRTWIQKAYITGGSRRPIFCATPCLTFV
ncbi:hypothetical protein OE88DRAFT_206128 [Heliocybe sulcata]|uniref:Uncharacterized protein n=1 Tax=Heliocybe sulcata TaxID=5364 RepID=A0A5C3N4G2_9AGAM|nr:hypothetical protein OE88DRAFT_206128 [Heliocybe sulcata]